MALFNLVSVWEIMFSTGSRTGTIKLTPETLPAKVVACVGITLLCAAGLWEMFKRRR